MKIDTIKLISRRTDTGEILGSIEMPFHRTAGLLEEQIKNMLFDYHIIVEVIRIKESW